MIALPPCTVYSYPISFNPTERSQYEALEVAAKRHLQHLLDTNSFERQYATVLEMMMRLRQTCNHLSLCPSNYLQKLRQGVAQETPLSTVDYSTEAVQTLVEILREATDTGEDCAICMDPLQDAYDVQPAHLVADVAASPLLEMDQVLPSSKMEALLKLLRLTPPGVKSVVFSQWTSMLALTKKVLQANDIPSMSYDGSMSRTTRDQHLKSFKEDGPNVLLMSLKCVFARYVPLVIYNSMKEELDPWWNTAIETQAIDRVFRLGQTRPVHVFKFVVANSIEERVVAIQTAKAALIKQAFQGIKGASDSAVNEKRLDIATLFQLDWRPN
ncbi:hypothetical protein DYB31_012787 [Aphanomyces astaci]|uniref:Helicase C-terminal domain-containing protein n=1 Tax=Aphanomyces astaci TaxID=112090 RepID=A0A397EU59_APHAT|nr:hypothetical protein DYB31_012787 [Aphanomyces astaci]